MSEMAAVQLMPTRSLEQRMIALAHGNEIRSARAVLKRDVKAGSVPVCTILLVPPGWCDTMRVYELLMAVPKVGCGKAEKYLKRAGISLSKTLGGMTERQRRDLAAMLGVCSR